MAKDELLSTYIAHIEKALKKVEHKHVILSTDVPEERIGRRRNKVRILWPLYEHSMFYITTLKDGTRVRPHQHDENVFRYVIHGEIDIIVGRTKYTVKKGIWVAVRARTNYSLVARSNPHCKLFVAYQYMCKNL